MQFVTMCNIQRPDCMNFSEHRFTHRPNFESGSKHSNTVFLKPFEHVTWKKEKHKIYYKTLPCNVCVPGMKLFQCQTLKKKKKKGRTYWVPFCGFVYICSLCCFRNEQKKKQKKKIVNKLTMLALLLEKFHEKGVLVFLPISSNLFFFPCP